MTRWHPVEEEWKDASLPLPVTPAEEGAEYAAREAAEAEEAKREGEFDWHVVDPPPRAWNGRRACGRATSGGARTASPLAYVTVGVLTEERAQELLERLQAQLPEDADVRIEVDLSDVARSPLQFLPF